MLSRITTQIHAIVAPEEQFADFAQLYHDYSAMVRGVVFRIAGANEIDDIVQDCFIRIWQNRKKFRGDSTPRTWIYRIAVNSALNFIRQRKRTEPSSDLARNSLDRGADQIMEDQQLIQQGLFQLSVEHRTVLILHVMEGLKIDEIAIVLDKPVGTIKSRLHHGRNSMRDFLQRKGVSP